MVHWFSASRIYVEDLLAQGMENGTAELHSRKYSVVQADGTYFGEIQVGLGMTHKVPLTFSWSISFKMLDMACMMNQRIPYPFV